MTAKSTRAKSTGAKSTGAKATGAKSPKYEHAYRTILERLKVGTYPVGGRIPTESELAEQFGVSRVTIRRALELLVLDGYVESRQGSGYRVLTLSPASDTCLTSFTDAMLRAGRSPVSRLLSIDRLDPGMPGTESLPEDLASAPTVRVRRLRLVDGEPRMLVNTFAGLAVLGDARPEDFPETGPNQSILRILSDRFGLQWSAACEDVAPVLAGPENAELFGIDANVPLLLQSCSAFDETGATVFHEDVFRTGRVSFTLGRTGRSANF